MHCHHIQQAVVPWRYKLVQQNRDGSASQAVINTHPSSVYVWDTAKKRPHQARGGAFEMTSSGKRRGGSEEYLSVWFRFYYAYCYLSSNIMSFYISWRTPTATRCCDEPESCRGPWSRGYFSGTQKQLADFQPSKCDVLVNITDIFGVVCYIARLLWSTGDY